MTYLSRSLLLLVIMSLGGCSTIVEKTYNQTSIGSDQKEFLSKSSSTSEIIVERVKYNGENAVDIVSKRFPDYRAIGTSMFKTTTVGDTELKQQALSSGASLVVLFEKWTGSVQSGAIGNAIPVTGGGALAVAIPLTSDRYEFLAIFLAKYTGGKDRIGIHMKPLTTELQQRFERNKGIYIDTVGSRGPAFDANVLNGDILIKVADSDVIDINTVGELIRNACRKGQPFTLDVLRGENTQKRQLTISRCD